ncbi:uncharacterized protein METZ01_LOCUS217002, partial [marine metagenome]
MNLEVGLLTLKQFRSCWSMMRQMRDNTKWIMLTTAIAFVGLMVFQWGMDITGQGGMTIGEIGRVNGTPILIDDFNQINRRL